MSELDRYYTELSGALGQVMPDLKHLHYGVADAPPKGLAETLRVLKNGPEQLLSEALDGAASTPA